MREKTWLDPMTREPGNLLKKTLSRFRVKQGVDLSPSVFREEQAVIFAERSALTACAKASVGAGPGSPQMSEGGVFL